MRGVSLIACALGLFTLGTVQGALACTCTKRSVAEIVCDAQVVFEGEATKTTTVEMHRRSVTTFRVTTNWRDADKPEIDVVHAVMPSMCGVGFDDHGKYLVFAYRQQDQLTTGLCSLTKADPASVRPALQEIQNRSFATPAACVAAVDKALNNQPSP